MNIRTNLASARRGTVAHGYPSPVVTTLARGQALLHAGQYGALWRVVSGAFRVERQGDGAHALIQLALPGDCIGLESLFGQPCTVTVSALGYISSAQGFFNRMAAASVVSSIPQIVLALSIQRYLIRGLSFGAVKG